MRRTAVVHLSLLVLTLLAAGPPAALAVLRGIVGHPFLGGPSAAIDVATDTQIATFPIGNVGGVAFHPTGRWAYLGDTANDTVLRIDSTTFAVDATIPVAGKPY